MVAPSLKSEQELFCEYRLTHDKKLRDEIIERYVYISEIIAKKFTKNNRLYVSVSYMPQTDLTPTRA